LEFAPLSIVIICPGIGGDVGEWGIGEFGNERQSGIRANPNLPPMGKASGRVLVVVADSPIDTATPQMIHIGNARIAPIGYLELGQCTQPGQRIILIMGGDSASPIK